MTARSPHEAIQWALKHPTNEVGMCQMECRNAYDVNSNGREGTANQGWLDTPEEYRHGPDITPWKGLLAHFAKDGDPHNGDGHITIVRYPKHDISTDMLPGKYAPGHRSEVLRTDIEVHMGLKLIGFSEQIDGVHVAPKPKPKPKPAEQFYAVRKGDTLFGIAAKFHLTLAELEKMNPTINHPNKIQIGQKVRVK